MANSGYTLLKGFTQAIATFLEGFAYVFSLWYVEELAVCKATISQVGKYIITYLKPFLNPTLHKTPLIHLRGVWQNLHNILYTLKSSKIDPAEGLTHPKGSPKNLEKSLLHPRVIWGPCSPLPFFPLFFTKLYLTKSSLQIISNTLQYILRVL